ncbi:MAG: hypothetical protein ACT4OX_06010 [Actinomycetota bacterium]
MGGTRGQRRALVLLVGAMILVPAPARAQETPTTPAPEPVPAPAPPPPPPPTPFGMAMDAGRDALAERVRARFDIAATEPQLANAIAQRDELQYRWNGLTAELVQLDSARQRTMSHLATARAHVAASAAAAYIHSGTGRMDAAIGAMGEADDFLEVSRDLHLISTFGEFEMGQVEQFEVQKAQLDRTILDVSLARADVRKQLDAANTRVANTRAFLEDAQVRLMKAEATILRFYKAATTAGSPILGPNQLTARQMADFIRANGYTPRISVTIDELAQLFFDESAKVGVRGDVAWAQSILETGGFGFAGSMVEPEDNNYAGVGACDSCTRGFIFPDARTGVRAQVQLLRIYTDKSVTLDSLPDEIVLKGTLRLGFRGKVQSWWDLTGTWATANDYGIRVYDLYMRMVEFAATQPPAPGA